MTKSVTVLELQKCCMCFQAGSQKLTIVFYLFYFDLFATANIWTRNNFSLLTLNDTVFDTNKKKQQIKSKYTQMGKKNILIIF